MIYRYHLSRRQLSRPRNLWRKEKAFRTQVSWLLQMRPGDSKMASWARLSGGRSGGSPWPRWVTRGLLGAVTVGGLLAGLVWSANEIVDTLTHADIFRVREVRAFGLERLQSNEVLQRLQHSSDASLFDLDLAVLKEELLAEPWIKEVSLRKEYPDGLSVQVTERRPVAVLADWNGAAIVDDSGAAMQRWAEESEVPQEWNALPRVQGVSSLRLAQGDPGALRAFFTALELLRTAPTDIGHTNLDHLRIQVGNPEDVRVQRNGYELRFGSAPYHEKWRRFFSIEREIGQRYPEAREIDLRFPKQVIARDAVREKGG